MVYHFGVLKLNWRHMCGKLYTIPSVSMFEVNYVAMAMWVYVSKCVRYEVSYVLVMEFIWCWTQFLLKDIVYMELSCVWNDFGTILDLNEDLFWPLIMHIKSGIFMIFGLPNRGQAARAEVVAARAEKREINGEAYCFWPLERWRGTARAVHVRTSGGYGRTCGPGWKFCLLRFTCLTLSSFQNLCLIPVYDCTCNWSVKM